MLAFQAIDLTFVRHAETVANATGRYNEKTLNTFSGKGEEQVEALTGKLKKSGLYDVILVSPSPRAMRTILPYLKLTRQKATIAPLLYECCTMKRPPNAKPEPFKWGGKVTIPSDCKGYFNLAPGQDRLPVASTYNQGLAQVAAFEKSFRSGYRGARVLIIGHSGHGGQFLHGLTGKWKRVENATPMTVRVP